VKLLKLWFLGRLLREKLLILILVIAGSLIWLSSASGRLTATMRGFRVAEAELESQSVVLSNREAIEESAKIAVSHLDPAKTYDATFLVSEVDKMAKRAGLTANTAPPRTQRSPQFAVHTVQMISARAEMASVLRFYQELASRAPYLGLKKVSIQGDRATPGMIRITFEIDSVELLSGAGGQPATVAAAKEKA
jgi:hypothetical protein